MTQTQHTRPGRRMHGPRRLAFWVHGAVGAAGVALIVWNGSPLVFDGLMTADKDVGVPLAVSALVVGTVVGAVEGAFARGAHQRLGAAAFVLGSLVALWLPLLLSGSWGEPFEGDGFEGSSSAVGNGTAGWCLFLAVQLATAWALTSVRRRDQVPGHAERGSATT